MVVLVGIAMFKDIMYSTIPEANPDINKSDTLINALSFIQQHQSVQLSEYFVAGLMNRENDGSALLCQFVEYLENVVCHVAVQSRSRLIQNQQIWFVDYFHCNTHSLLLST